MWHLRAREISGGNNIFIWASSEFFTFVVVRELGRAIGSTSTRQRSTGAPGRPELNLLMPFLCLFVCLFICLLFPCLFALLGPGHQATSHLQPRRNAPGIPSGQQQPSAHRVRSRSSLKRFATTPGNQPSLPRSGARDMAKGPAHIDVNRAAFMQTPESGVCGWVTSYQNESPHQMTQKSGMTVRTRRDTKHTVCLIDTKLMRGWRGEWGWCDTKSGIGFCFCFRRPPQSPHYPASRSFSRVGSSLWRFIIWCGLPVVLYAF